MNGSEVSGVDLARVALRAAMEAARPTAAAQGQGVAAVVHAVSRFGPEPMGLNAAIGALVTERVGAPGRRRDAARAVGSHRPRFAGHVTAVAYDADSGQLTVCSGSAS